MCPGMETPPRCRWVACAGPSTSSPGNTGPAKRLNYVAVGDSFAAAPGVPDPAPPAGCHKSTNGYPSILARQLNATSFVNVTCSGATTEDITGRVQQTKDGPVARQIDAVDASADLITVTIGANDVGLPSDAEGCEVKSADPPPCTDLFVVGNVDRISQLIGAVAGVERADRPAVGHGAARADRRRGLRHLCAAGWLLSGAAGATARR